MKLFDLGTVFLFWALVRSSQGQNCPILGPAYPAVTDPASSSVLRQAKAASDEALTFALSSGELDANGTSFSIRVFSPHVEEPIYEYHHTASTSNNGSSRRKVGPATLYRIGSISKLVAVYAILSKLSDRYWDEPVTKYVQELAAAAADPRDNAVDNVQWSEVTLGALASQMSGIGRDCKCCLGYPIFIVPIWGYSGRGRRGKQ